jgi:hypothetical protein
MERDERHLGEDVLVLHYYGELPPADEAAAALHLAACGACRGAFTTLQRVLGMVGQAAAAEADPPPGFERAAWARVEPALTPHRTWSSWLMASPAPLAFAAAVLVLVAAAFFAGRTLTPGPPAQPIDAPRAAQLRERILLLEVAEHLERSQAMLVELVSATGGGAHDITAERLRAEHLVADNRLYRLAAEQAGDAALTDLLDEVGRVLTDLAAGPAQLTDGEFEEMRRRIEGRDLLFKVRVVSSEMRERQKEMLRRRTEPRS